MPVITDLRLPMTIEEVISSWGSRRTRLASARMTAMLSDLVTRIESNHWIEPKISFEVWPIVSGGPDCFELSGGLRISSHRLRHHLPGASHLAAGVCTVGGALEKQVSAWFATSDRLRAVMLDEIGTLALFRLGDRVEELMRAEAGKYGLAASGVLSPGEDGFEISQQAAVLQLARSAEIGILQRTSGMLTPRKSLSMIVGFGARMPVWTRGERCAHCGARDRCPHRRPQFVEVTT